MAVRVFLVEDITATRDLIVEACRALGGFRVVGSAVTEAEARLWLEENQRGWDLAILDLILEQGSGIQVLAHARRQPTPGKVIIFSSYATPGVHAKCIALGAAAVFDKADSEGFIAWLAALPR